MILVLFLLVHETWIFLQHANILLNPLCQRLDRNYGIALLKNGMSWVISLTLSAYWLREIFSMLSCYSIVSQRTRYLIIISVAYHTFKAINICIDSWRQWSPKLGIMRLLIDYWHWDTYLNILISLKRLFLQAFDTIVHGTIIFDILFPISSSFSSNTQFLLAFKITSLLWLFHAIIVQISQKSTATIMVELFKRLAIMIGILPYNINNMEQMPHIQKRFRNNVSNMNIIRKFLGKHFYAPTVTEKECEVCQLLGRPNHSIQYKTDVTFLIHPFTFVSSAVQLISCNKYEHKYMMNDKLRSISKNKQFWNPSWYMHLLSPVTFFISILWWPLQLLFTKSKAYYQIDSIKINHSNHHYHHLQNNNINYENNINLATVWIVKSFAWQFVSTNYWRRYSRYVVEHTVLQADQQDVKVIGLGALTKAYHINKGGKDILLSLQQQNYVLKGIKIVSGNTLTAAVTWKCICNYFEKYELTHQRIIMTGASSSVGRAVILKLFLEGYDVLCITEDSKRMHEIRSEAIALYDTEVSKGYSAHLKKGSILCYNNALAAVEKYPDAIWVLGKAMTSESVLRHLIPYIPYSALVMIFAIPSPVTLDMRPDLKIVDVGLVEVPEDLKARQFSLYLPSDKMYACHAGTLVHYLEGWTHHEVGDADVELMGTVLEAAKRHGFKLTSSLDEMCMKSKTKLFNNNQMDESTSKKGSIMPINSMDVRTSLNSHNNIPNQTLKPDRIENVLNDLDYELYDVAIVGGGSSGLATAAWLQKLSPNINYVIYDKNPFPQGQVNIIQLKF